ncbi:type II toxin-antitoxin system RelE/ParE family toxin [Hominifimenecus sp. rT4P-3]|uniref:type II toxin-antitoxin system RelE/ParE family toxin n=1 Tax=Hominifimenecus sp. rT4P-3 TaxID=3242979 RepID=UPI003DA5CEB4
MENKSYQLRYLPLFEQDLICTANYITNVLKNGDAAFRLVNDVEAAILERLKNPLAFEPYPSAKKRKYPYYRIYVRNYVVYYVVIDRVMEVRRLMYGARDTDKYLM